MYSHYTADRSQNFFMHAVYAWMAAALSVSAATAYYTAYTPSLFMLVYKNPSNLLILFLLQIGLVTALNSMVMRIQFATAVALFIGYAFLTGLAFSLFIHLYTMASLGATFLTTAIMFGSMALYGYTTKTDLTTAGNASGMAAWGILVALLINIWFKNPFFDLVISAVGVILFSILTAFDTQKIKAIAHELSTDDETLSKISIIGALVLYLDFINIFLFLLRFLGKRRQD